MPEEYLEMPELIDKIINVLIEEQHYLLRNNANERSITHHLAIIINRYFKEYDIDCEYNRLDDKIKSITIPNETTSWKDTDAKSVFPDIIVHRRGSQDENKLVIEVKKSSNTSSRKKDKNKLQAYKNELGYEFAVFILIGVDDNYGKYEIEFI